MRNLTGLLLTVSTLVAVAAPAHAQTADPRWKEWIGCWAVSGSRTPMARVCVSPAQGVSAVDIVTTASSGIVTREHVDASGAQRQGERDGCTGWERAEWSADARRVFLSSEYKCPNGPIRSSTGLLAMSRKGQWLSIAGVTLGDNTGVRVLRYDPVDSTPADSAERAATAGTIGTAEIAEASRRLNASVVSAWLSESGQAFTADAKRLTALADAEVPGAVIDMLVALSYPGAFAVKPSPTTAGMLAGGLSGSSGSFDGPLSAIGGCGPYAASGFDEFGRLSLYGWDGCSMYYGYSRYEYSPYLYSPYGIAPYGSWYSGAQPVVIVRAPAGASEHGQVTRGGYVQGHDGGTSTSGGSTSGSGSSSSSGSAGTSGASSSTGTSSSGDRTAHPR